VGESGWLKLVQLIMVDNLLIKVLGAWGWVDKKEVEVGGGPPSTCGEYPKPSIVGQ